MNKMKLILTGLSLSVLCVFGVQAQSQSIKSIVERFVNEAPVVVQIGKNTLTFDREGENYVARQGDFVATLTVEPLATLPGKRWSMTVGNRGSRPVENVSIIPLHQVIKLGDYAADRPQVRHVTGSYHYDATYPPRAFRVFEERFMTNDHCKPLTYGGRSAYDNVPMMQFALASGREKVGFTALLEWSSSWTMTAQWTAHTYSDPPQHSDFVVSGDFKLDNITVLPGETLEIPAVHLIYSRGSWDDFTADLHRYILDEIRPPLENSPSTSPVSYDHWFGIHEEFDVNEMKRQADRAATLGCEYFVVDCGWATPSWGGTEVDKKKFPNGMEELAGYVRSKGMLFGLWNSTEIPKDMTHFHEPWVMNVHKEALQRWVKDWDIRWMRLEGANLPEGKEGLKAMKAMKELYGGFLREHPDFYLEGCQGGGTRLDLNMAKMSHGTWLTDHTGDPDVCRFNQTGALRVWPAQYLNMAVRAHRGSGDGEAFAHNFLSRMTGILTFNGDIAQWSPQAVALAKKHVDVFKQIRPYKEQPVSFPLPQPGSQDEWDAVVFGDGRGEAQLLFVFRMEGADEQFIKTPDAPGKWELLLDNGNARMKKEKDGYRISLNRNSSALWIRKK
jgi:alpha-galactosidase